MNARRLTILVMLVSLTVLGCSSEKNRSQTSTPTPAVEVSGAENGKDITISVGGTLKLTLTANHSTPFRWAPDTQIGDASVLQQTGHQYTASATTGGPGIEFWTFRALKVGTTTISNQENSVVDKGVAPLDKFTAKVIVK